MYNWRIILLTGENMTAIANVAQKEKNGAALSSVLAAVGLTSMKLVIGILTGSLGILAEAAHSALDLVAALVTFFAVKLSGKPADKEHTYGHGKIENLSALFETLLLLVTCVWIIYESIDRLFFNPKRVEATFWAFLVMFVSIAIDFTRSRILLRTAKKYNSQALEADALHFSTDIYSSAVVILGLAFVKIGDLAPGITWLGHADAIAALGVAAIVIVISMQLGKRTIMALLDTAPAGMEEKIIQIVEGLPGVVNCHNVRLRYSGAHLFADVHVLLAGNQSLDEVHAITDVIEVAIKHEMPDVDIVVHPEPVDDPPELTEQNNVIQQTVEAIPGVVNCHEVNINYSDEGLAIIVHVNMDGSQTLQDAHTTTETIEKKILEIQPTAHVTVHPEPI
ncbi:MAG: cation-efflux pump [Anaerolineaceae bacterium]